MKSKKIIWKILIIFIFIILIMIFAQFKLKSIIANLRFSQFASLLVPIYNNKNNIVIKESGVNNESDHEEYWLNSGGLFYLQGDYGHTILGDLPKYSPWRLAYENSNPLDTDDGYHPQNIFRLITKKAESNLSQSVYALIVNDNLSQSPNRNDSNGIFLISRYSDSNNLYYAGIRVDGTAIIKKKKNGVYHTLAQVKIFEGDEYNRNTNPSLLPKNKWLGLRVDIQDIYYNGTQIDLYLDKENTGTWIKELSIQDKTSLYNTPLFGKGKNGIRSDFMDIEIKDYLRTTLIRSS